MTKYLETADVQPTTTKTVFVSDGSFSWEPQNDRLAAAGVVEVPDKGVAAPKLPNHPFTLRRGIV